MILSVLVLVILCGCIEREMTIHSEPEGALVYVSNEPVGRTPVTVPFIWYGDYDIMLRKDGYETLKTHAEINAPYHQYPPLDFFVEIAPWTVTDKRYLKFDMSEQQQVSDAELIERARGMRERNEQPVE